MVLNGCQPMIYPCLLHHFLDKDEMNGYEVGFVVVCGVVLSGISVYFDGEIVSAIQLNMLEFFVFLFLKIS